MVDKIEYSEQAQIEIHKAMCFFDFTGKGDDFLDDLFRHEDLIRIMPEMFQIKYGNIRIVNLQSFNYSIHYIYQDDIIYIYRLLQQRQNY